MPGYQDQGDFEKNDSFISPNLSYYSLKIGSILQKIF